MLKRKKKLGVSNMNSENANYVFKLNVQPHILQQFGANGLGHLKTKVIPTVIFNSYNDLLTPVEEEINQLSFTVTNDFSYITNNSEFKLLLDITSEIAYMYKQITIDYKNEKGIFYTPTFLEKLENAIDLRKQVLSSYPILEQSGPHYENSIIDVELEKQYKFKINNDVGKGIDHLRRVKKIELYLNDLLEKDEKNILVHYEYEQELLVIHDVNIEDAIEYSRRIEEKINSQKTDIGKISINPIYAELVLTRDDLSSIEIITTYPNGTNDELDLLLQAAQQTGAKEVRTKLVSSDGQPLELFTEQSRELAEYPGKKGYLVGVRASGKNIINFILSKIRKI